MRPPCDLTTLIDELGSIRRTIQELKRREADIRKHLLEARVNGPVSARFFSLSVHHSQQRRINRAALPQHIQDDPRYWKTVQTTTLTTKPAPVAPPFNPIPSNQAHSAAKPDALIDAEDEFHVIEPF